MGLFGKKKEAEEKLKENAGGPEMPEELSVKVLGSGCAKCNELEANVRAAADKLGVAAVIDHVTDFTEIASYGVMSTPALVVNGKVVSCGKVLKEGEAAELLKKSFAG